jgi:tagaturonate reductase
MLKPLNRTTANCGDAPPVKILQFGEGNFLRAFVDWMIDILNERNGFNAGVEVVQPISKGMGDQLNQQDGLYHVVLKGLRDGKPITDTRLVKCISRCINPYNDFELFLKAAENPALRFIVSNTTEAGISFNASDIRKDGIAESFPGKVTQLLWHRYQAFNGDPKKGFIFLPCELIEKNGNALKKTVWQIAELWSLPKEFLDWVESANTFCNTLVDRIVPGFPKDNIDEIRKDLGYDDRLVVQAEPFHLWVIDGPDFVREEFPLHTAGLDVQFVKDITPYRTRKVRILNGAHTSLVPVAYLAGFRTVRESVIDERVGSFMERVIFDEVIPTLDLPTEELKQFARDVLERFKNPYIRHELLSIALNSISKFKVRVLPSILEFVKRKGKLPENLVVSFAALLLFYKGKWNGESIPLDDSADVLQFFAEVWKQSAGNDHVSKILANTALWGEDLSSIEGLDSKIGEKMKVLEATEKV